MTYTSYRIKEFREAQKMTQSELAEKSGVSRSIISELETGRRSVTQTDTLGRIAKALGKNVSEIFLNESLIS